MALIKVKPTSPGRRSLVKVVTPELYKGRPFDALTESQKRGSGRNNNGHITVRHKGGGHKQHYRIVDFRRQQGRWPRRWNDSNMTRTAARTWQCCSTPTASGATLSPARRRRGH